MLQLHNFFFRAPPLMAFALLAAFLLTACGELAEEREFYRRELQFVERFHDDIFEKMSSKLPSWFGESSLNDPECAANSDFLEELYRSYTSLEWDILLRHTYFTQILLGSLSEGRRPPPAYYEAFRQFLKDVAVPNARLLASRTSWFLDYAKYGKVPLQPVLTDADRLWREYTNHAEQTLAQLEKNQAAAEKGTPQAEKNASSTDSAKLFSPAPFPAGLADMPVGTVAPALTLAYLTEFKSFAERSYSLHQAAIVKQAALDRRKLFQERYTLMERVYALNMQMLVCALDTHAVYLRMLQNQAASDDDASDGMYELVYCLAGREGLSRANLLNPGYPRSSRLQFLPEEVRPVLQAMAFRLVEYENVLRLVRERLETCPARLKKTPQ